MEHQNVYSEADEAKEASYSIIRFASRELPKSYRNLLFSKYLHTLRTGNDYYRLSKKDSYYRVKNEEFAAYLARPNATVTIACLSDDSDVVLGWALFQGAKLHYVYVGREYRNNGIANSLLPTKVDEFTHITNTWLKIWNKKYPRAEFDPYA